MGDNLLKFVGKKGYMVTFLDKDGQEITHDCDDMATFAMCAKPSPDMIDDLRDEYPEEFWADAQRGKYAQRT